MSKRKSEEEDVKFPVSTYSQTYIPNYYSKLNNKEQTKFIKLFDNPFNKYVEYFRDPESTPTEKLEDYMIKLVINLSDEQDNYLDLLDQKYS